MISISFKRKIIFLFFCLVIFSKGYSQEFANESRREYNNFYFQFGGPEKVLYDLLTNEAIGNTNQEYIKPLKLVLDISIQILTDFYHINLKH